MAGNLGGATTFTGVRVGGGTAEAGLVSSGQSDGVAKVWESHRTFAVPAITAVANATTLSSLTFPGARAGDFARAVPASSLSSGAALPHCIVPSNNSVLLVYSNSSTAALALAAHTVNVVVERYGLV